MNWWHDPASRSLGHASVPLGITGFLAVIVLFATFDSSAPAGLIERVSVYTAVLWQVRTALHLLLARRRTPDPRAEDRARATAQL